MRNVPTDPTRTAAGVDTDHPSAGFSLAEVMIALVILVFGLVALAQGSVLMVNQVNASDVRTERVIARTTAIEQLRAIPFDSVDTDNMTVGEFTVAWRIASATTNSRLMQMVTTGPGIRRGSGTTQVAGNVADTVSFRILRP